jgi:hypothetical protein
LTTRIKADTPVSLENEAVFAARRQEKISKMVGIFSIEEVLLA